MLASPLVLAADDTNRPLAIAVVVVSSIAIVASIVWTSRRRSRSDGGLDDTTLAALDTVEWFAEDVGKQLDEADAVDRAAILARSGARAEAAQRVLVKATSAGDNDWMEPLLVELAAARAAYQAFASEDVTAEPVDATGEPATVAQNESSASGALEPTLTPLREAFEESRQRLIDHLDAMPERR